MKIEIDNPVIGGMYGGSGTAGGGYAVGLQGPGTAPGPASYVAAPPPTVGSVGMGYQIGNSGGPVAGHANSSGGGVSGAQLLAYSPGSNMSPVQQHMQQIQTGTGTGSDSSTAKRRR